MFEGFITLAVCIVIMVFVYERRRPSAREAVMCAILCAIVVLVSLFFRATIPVNAGTALVIMSGISFGPGAGFMVGAVSRLVLNFYEGQGPWTAWQMLCWGGLGILAGVCFLKEGSGYKRLIAPIACLGAALLIAWLSMILLPQADGSLPIWRIYAFGAAGLLAGFILAKGALPQNGFSYAAFTFLSVIFLYGGIMNLASFFTLGGSYGIASASTLAALYVTGLPYDAAHAASAAVFMFLFGPYMIKVFERVKIKYGFYRVKKRMPKK